jgi:short-chain fatty acids transporter
MSWSQRIESWFRFFLPGPFGLAVALTFIAVAASILHGNSIESISKDWQSGFWDPPLLVFTVQMALILLLGYSVAVSPPANRFIERSLRHIHGQRGALILLTTSSMILCWINWGLGLVMGAIMARKIAENLQNRNLNYNYPLLGAAGYSGMMTWHSGLSGSAPLKAAEPNHLRELSGIAELPEVLSIQSTVLSTTNIGSFLMLLVLIPLALLIFSKKNSSEIQIAAFTSPQHENISPRGAERFEHSKWIAGILGLALFAIHIHALVLGNGNLNPNILNGIFLSLAIILHGSIAKFFSSIRAGMDGAAAILIQFPFYFGIMGILRYGDLISSFTDWFLQWSSPGSQPIYIMLSAGIVNLFVPSGGGQWAVQGPLILSICQESGLDLSLGIMAMAYGDQLTNMLQPFWALPLLAITGLKAHQVLPYTAFIMLIGVLIYSVLLIVLGYT